MEEDDTDSLTLREVLDRLWRRRGLVIVLPLLALLGGVAAMALVSFRGDRPLTYYVRLNSIENSNYPNGTAFSPGDLVSNPVLSRLRSELKLPADIELERNIQVVLDSPFAESISRQYRDRLTARNLTQADINALNEAFGSQLKSTISKSLRIDVNYLGMGMDEAQGRTIALALPRLWADVYTRQFRTLVSQQISATIPKIAIDQFRNTAGVIAIDSRMSEMKRGLEAIGTDNRLSSVMDKQGNTFEDLLERLEVYSDVHYTPLFATFMSDKSLTSVVYLKNQSLQIEDLQRQLAGVDDSVAKLQEFQRASVATPPTTGDPAGQQNVQLDAGALSQVVSLAEKASNSEFLKELLTRRQEIVTTISSIRRRVDLANMGTSDANLAANFDQQAYNLFTDLVARYNEIVAAARERAEDRSGALYQVLTSPEVEGGLISPRWLLLLSGLTAAGLFIAAVYAIFIAPSLAERRAVAESM